MVTVWFAERMAMTLNQWPPQGCDMASVDPASFTGSWGKGLCDWDKIHLSSLRVIWFFNSFDFKIHPPGSMYLYHLPRGILWKIFCFDSILLFTRNF